MTKKSKTLPIILAAVAVATVAVLAFPDPGLAAAQQQMLEAVTQPDGTVTQGMLTGRVQYQADSGKISFLTAEGDSLQVINAVQRP